MTRKLFVFTMLLLAAQAALKAGETPVTRPNFVYVLCDDLGYGDVHTLNPERGKIATPNMDRLRAEGMAFTDCHSGSAVCTPSRYCILTGRYCWRTRLQSGVLGGFSRPLIEAARLTVPKLLGQHGYFTACIGKWHLGMTMATGSGHPFGDGIDTGIGSGFDPHAAIADGPATRGFDSYFGISASLDMPPFAFIENDRFTEAPTAVKSWVRAGPAAPGFEAVDVLPTLTRKACEFLGSHATDARHGKPFFLYLPLTSPHAPIVPAKEWQGKSGLNPYADFVMQTDDSLGRVLKALEENGLADNTLVIFTSDNGCSPVAKTAFLESHGHHPSAAFRGYKSDIWDGGHRIPFLVRWPGVVKPGSTCGRTVELTDLIATVADLLGVKLPPDAGPDSASLLPLLKGNDRPVQRYNVYHSIDGNFAIQEGKWKLELCAGSGGWSHPAKKDAMAAGLPRVQLYDMAADVGEKHNVEAEHPEIVTRLTAELETCVAKGRSTPGPAGRNDRRVDLWKTPATSGKKPKLKPAGD